MTVQNGRCRDGGWADAAGRPPDFRYSGHHQKKGPKLTPDVAGLWKGWWRDGATEGLPKVVIFNEI